MSNLEIGLWSFPGLLALIFLRVPIGLAMFVTGLVGLYYVTDGNTVALSRLKNATRGPSRIHYTFTKHHYRNLPRGYEMSTEKR